MPAPAATAVRPFTISRTFDAPRERIFEAWTIPDRMVQWWGPKGFACHIARFELRPGGISHYRLTAPNNGPTMWGRSIFREIVPNQRLVFVNGFSDEHAGLGRHPMSPTWPQQMLTTITFADGGPNKTTVTIEWMPLDATAEELATFDNGRDSMTMGWTGTLDQLVAYLHAARANHASDGVLAVGRQLVALCNQGQNAEAVDTLYAPDIVSIEAMEMPGMPARTEGLPAVKARKKAFYDNTTVHSSSAEGPWPHGDRFIVLFKIDMTAKAGPMAGQRMQMQEAALFTVKNGKITQEEFFYGGCGG